MKDAYYFSHDSNAKDDPKCVLLIDQLGLEGYGIFWVLIETLREQPDYKYPVNLLPALARRYNTTAEKMNTVVKSYNLFKIDNEKIFFSESLINRMSVFDNKRKQARNAALKRWGYGRNADALPEQSGSNASKVNNSIVNNSKRDSILLSDDNNCEPNVSHDQPKIDYQNIINLYHTLCPSLPYIKALNDSRKKKIKIRLNEFGKYDKNSDPLETMKKIFAKLESSSFCKGDNKQNWKATFDWLFTNDSNWIKLIEGNYDNKSTNPEAAPEYKKLSGAKSY